MELEGTLYGLELLEAAVLRNTELNSLKAEAGELCAILVTLEIPVHARISVVNKGTAQTSQQVRASYNRLRPPEKLQVEKRAAPRAAAFGLN